MVLASEIRETILKLAEERGPEKCFRPADVAKRMDQENWQRHVDQVWFVADVLVREGKITANQEGEAFSLSRLKNSETSKAGQPLVSESVQIPKSFVNIQFSNTRKIPLFARHDENFYLWGGAFPGIFRMFKSNCPKSDQ